jgi:peptidyl-prolyl cis-trans isomerase C
MKLKVLSAAVAVSMVTLGCTQQSSTTDGPAASTGSDVLGSSTVQSAEGREVRESLFRWYALNALQKPAEQLTPQEREAVIENLVSLDLLADEAESRGLPRERTVAVELEIQRQQVLARTMINRYLEENPPSDAELRAEYESNLSQLERVEHKAHHILVESPDEANELIAQLDAGADFADLAREHSIDPAASNGGDLGWFTADTMVAPFADAVSQQEVGTHSAEPVQTQFGWHVIFVEDRRTNDPPPLDEVRAELSNRITQRRIEAFIDSLR